MDLDTAMQARTANSRPPQLKMATILQTSVSKSEKIGRKEILQSKIAIRQTRNLVFMICVDCVTKVTNAPLYILSRRVNNDNC